MSVSYENGIHIGSELVEWLEEVSLDWMCCWIDTNMYPFDSEGIEAGSAPIIPPSYAML